MADGISKLNTPEQSIKLTSITLSTVNTVCVISLAFNEWGAYTGEKHPGKVGASVKRDLN